MGKSYDIVLVGGGGHCRSVIDVIEECGIYEIRGIIDVAENVGKKVSGHEVIGTDQDIKNIARTFKNFCITLGHIKSNTLRKNLYNEILLLGATLPVIISPYAYVSKRSSLGLGSVVLHHAVINSNATIGVNNIINTSAVIEHDVSVGDHCHIGPGACINGGSTIAHNSFVGSNAVVLQSIVVNEGALIAAGTVVTKDIPTKTLVAGNPGTNKKQL